MPHLLRTISLERVILACSAGIRISPTKSVMLLLCLPVLDRAIRVWYEEGTVTSDQLHTYFRKFGFVESVLMQPPGRAQVIFEYFVSTEAASEALQHRIGDYNVTVLRKQCDEERLSCFILLYLAFKYTTSS